MHQQPDIDHFFQQRLHDAEVAPPAFVWPNVAQELQRRRRRRFLAWLFALGLIGSGMLAAGLLHKSAAVKSADTLQPVAPETAPATASPAPAAVDASAGMPAANQAKAGSPFSAGGAAEVPASPATTGVRTPRSSITSGKAEDAPLQAVTASPVPAANVAGAAPAVPADLGQKAPDFTGLPFLSGRVVPFLASQQAPHFPKTVFKNPTARKRKVRKNCYDFEKHANVWLLDAYAGPALADKTLRANADNQPYLNRRLDTEQRDWAFNAGLRASWLFDKHFLLRTGVHYDQFTEVFEFIDPNSVVVQVEYTTQVINGQTVTVADTIGVFFGENYVKTYNRFGMLDIPLLAGVELRQGNAGISLNAGASLNLLFWKRGDIIAPGADVPVTFTPGQNGAEVFRPRVGLSLHASAQFFYHLRPRLRVFAEPYYRRVMQPVNQFGHPVEQRYSIGGIRLGITKIID